MPVREAVATHLLFALPQLFSSRIGPLTGCLNKEEVYGDLLTAQAWRVLGCMSFLRVAVPY